MAAGLEPIALPEIASHLRDGTWLDMRVYDEIHDWITLENVKVTEYVIRRHNEQVTVVQAWAGHDDSMQRQELALDVEAIRWAKPTEHDPTTVTPYAMRVMVEPTDDAWGVIVQACAEHEGYCSETGELSVQEFKRLVLTHGDDGSLAFRHLVILVAYHVTRWTPDEICKDVGYRSCQPLITAASKWSRKKEPHWISRLRATVDRCAQRGCEIRPEDERSSMYWVL